MDQGRRAAGGGAVTAVAVLFARADSNYKTMPQCDVWGIERDARRFAGGTAVIAHPPCRAWGRLRAFARPRPDEKDLAFFAVRQVREWGGVLEHPAHSTLWPAAGLPVPGQRDEFGGWTLPIVQGWWGHRAEKATWLYIVGVEPGEIPEIPLVLGEASHVVSSSRGIRKGDRGWRPECSKAEREHTPPQLAAWLVELASRCAK